jgi:hypothetical protein
MKENILSITELNHDEITIVNGGKIVNDGKWTKNDYRAMEASVAIVAVYGVLFSPFAAVYMLAGGGCSVLMVKIAEYTNKYVAAFVGSVAFSALYFSFYGDGTPSDFFKNVGNSIVNWWNKNN